MILREYLPERSAEDIWAERIRVRLGGEDFVLAVLPMAASEDWKASVGESIGGLLLGLEDAADLDAVMRGFQGIEAGLLVRLLREYDREGLLPPDEWLGENATEGSILRAFLSVYAVANPTLAVIADTIVRAPALMSSLRETTSVEAPPRPGNGSPASTDGPHAELATSSPTSSS